MDSATKISSFFDGMVSAVHFSCAKQENARRFFYGYFERKNVFRKQGKVFVNRY